MQRDTRKGSLNLYRWSRWRPSRNLTKKTAKFKGGYQISKINPLTMKRMHAADINTEPPPTLEERGA